MTFAPASGGGIATGSTQTTSPLGIAAVGSWKLGASGANTLTASATGVTSVMFGATAAAVAGAATTLVLTTNAADAYSGAPFAGQPVVAIHDAAGNVVVSDNSCVVTMTVSSGASIRPTDARCGPGRPDLHGAHSGRLSDLWTNDDRRDVLLGSQLRRGSR